MASLTSGPAAPVRGHEALEQALNAWASMPARNKAERIAVLDAALTRHGILHAGRMLPMDYVVRKRDGSVTGSNTVGEWLLRLVSGKGEDFVARVVRAVEEASKDSPSPSVLGQHRDKAMRNLNVQVARLGQLLRTAERFMRSHDITYKLDDHGVSPTARGRVALEDMDLTVSAPGGTSMSTMSTARRYAALLALVNRLRGRYQDLQLTERSISAAGKSMDKKGRPGTWVAHGGPQWGAPGAEQLGAARARVARTQSAPPPPPLANALVSHTEEHVRFMRACHSAEEEAGRLEVSTMHRVARIRAPSSAIEAMVRRLRDAGLDVDVGE